MKLKLIIFFLFVTNIFFSQKKFEALNKKTEKIIEQFLEKEKIPGMAVSISYNDTLIYSKGYGFSDVDRKIPVNTALTKFRIASITKILTAATILKMSEIELIDINKSVYYYLDSLPKKQYDFTIKQVGGHIAGLKRVPSEEKYTCDNTYKKEDFYRVFSKDSLLFKPSSKLSYSNYGYKLLGLVVEKVSGEDIITCHKKYVLEPLKLKKTTIDDGVYDNNSSKFYIHKKNKIEEAPCLDCSFKYASGCYMSTSEDLIKLGNSFLFIDKFFKKQSLLQLITTQKLLTGEKTGYGFGFTTTKDSNDNFYYGHNGGYISSRSVLRIYPESKLVISILINIGIDDIDGLTSKISNLYIKKITE